MELLTIQQAADRLSVSPRTISRYISAGRLKACRVSHKVVRIKEADLNAMLESGAGATEGGGECKQ